MLRIYFPQQWLNLADPSVEEALYDSRAIYTSSASADTRRSAFTVLGRQCHHPAWASWSWRTHASHNKPVVFRGFLVHGLHVDLEDVWRQLDLRAGDN